MAKPRKQTYTMDMFLNSMKEQDIRQDQDVQRMSGQWSNSMMNELISTVLHGDYIPPIILGEEKSGQLWIIDGLQRGTTLMKFRYGNYRITTSVEEPIITYRAKVKDAEGNIRMDGNGDFIWEDRQYDIRNKTYDKLPEELRKLFSQYQIETVIHEGYEMKDISKLVRRYNFNKPMNVSQKAFTFVNNHARKIREILRKRFFVEAPYTRNERKNGTLERLIMESVMCMFHLDNWKKSGQLGTYINENATEEQFDVLENLISRLENIMTENLYGVFTSRDSFLWFTLFHHFTQLGDDDNKFAEFLTYFKETTENISVEELYGLRKENSSNKDKGVILTKLDKLEAMMREFLGVVKISLSEGKASSMLEFIQEQVNPDTTMEDVEQYAEVLEALARKTGKSKLWEDNNIPSLIAVVAWSFINDMDLDDWFVDYFGRNESYLSGQTENYKAMRDDLEQYLRLKEVA